MAGLRAKQKADKTRRILDSAATLFREQGYDSARIEDIAEMAEVSVGTLYNYYQNKGDILVATVAMEVTEVLQAGARILASPPLTVCLTPLAMIESTGKSRRELSLATHAAIAITLSTRPGFHPSSNPPEKSPDLPVG